MPDTLVSSLRACLEHVIDVVWQLITAHQVTRVRARVSNGRVTSVKLGEFLSSTIGMCRNLFAEFAA